MKRNLNKVLTTFDGEEMQSANGNVATAKIVIVDALIAQDIGLSATDKVKHFNLAEHIVQSNDPVELKIEELQLIKDAVGKHFNPLVVGKVYRILEDEE